MEKLNGKAVCLEQNAVCSPKPTVSGFCINYPYYIELVLEFYVRNFFKLAYFFSHDCSSSLLIALFVSGSRVGLRLGCLAFFFPV